MPSLNISALGIINQTLKYHQTEPFPKAGRIAFQLVIALFGVTTNGLIEFVLLKNKKLRGETITPSIVSLSSWSKFAFFCWRALFTVFAPMHN